jgi:hypothetical protein
MAQGYPGGETDRVYEWLREGVQGSEGMPLNVQVSMSFNFLFVTD